MFESVKSAGRSINMIKKLMNLKILSLSVLRNPKNQSSNKLGVEKKGDHHAREKSTRM